MYRKIILHFHTSQERCVTARTLSCVHVFSGPPFTMEAEKLETMPKNCLNAGENKNLGEAHKCISAYQEEKKKSLP